MVYTQVGLPIYSKCYGQFCKAAFKNPELLSSALTSALHDHGGFEDQCPSSDKCPITSIVTESKKRSIWSVVKDKYQSMK